VLIGNATGESIGRAGLAELTTSETWERMHVQIFQARERSANRTTWLVEDGHVREIGSITSLCVADLDRDEVPELIFTYLRKNRGVVAAYVPALGEIVFGDRVFRDGAWIADKVDDHEVGLVTADPVRTVKLATLSLRNRRLRLVLRPHLPKEVRSRLRH
jgi:hypothetical protein